jgi:hypothetical protein
MSKAQDDYDLADRLYQAWVDEHPNVDPWKDETGARLAKARNDALTVLLATNRAD